MKPTRPLIFFLLFALAVGLLPANGAGLFTGGSSVETNVWASVDASQLAVTEPCQLVAAAQAKSVFDDDFDDDDLDFEIVAATKLLPIDWCLTDPFPAYSQQCLSSPAYLIQFSKRGPPAS